MIKKIFTVVIMMILFREASSQGFSYDSSIYRVKLYALGRFVDNAIHFEDIYDYNFDTTSILMDYKMANYNSGKKSGQVYSYYCNDTFVSMFPYNCLSLKPAEKIMYADSLDDFIPVLLLVFSCDSNQCQNDSIEIDGYRRVRLKYKKDMKLMGYSPIPYKKKAYILKLYDINECLLNFILSMLPEDLRYNWSLSNEKARSK